MQEYNGLMETAAARGIECARGLDIHQPAHAAAKCIPSMGRVSSSRAERVAKRIAHGQSALVMEVLEYAAETRQNGLVLFSPENLPKIEGELKKIPGGHVIGTARVAGEDTAYAMRLGAGRSIESVGQMLWATDVRIIEDSEYDLQGLGAIRGRQSLLQDDERTQMQENAIKIGAERGRSR